MTKLIRNSTAEFLIFTSQAGENSIEVRVEGETVWLTQKMMAQLFEIEVPAINKHISNVLAEGALTEATISKMEIVQQQGASDFDRLLNMPQVDEPEMIQVLTKMSDRT
jgi:hypothetical protein